VRAGCRAGTQSMGRYSHFSVPAARFGEQQLALFPGSYPGAK
jgi:hypothetical protein